MIQKIELFKLIFFGVLGIVLGAYLILQSERVIYNLTEKNINILSKKAVIEKKRELTPQEMLTGKIMTYGGGTLTFSIGVYFLIQFLRKLF